ncbi:GNAT family N-acetyltransferase [Methylobacterium indicum]|uniref:GNAT family N-acetyltransferase n=1 Tax=Methylobacterium indicum TaxID=1775910 RepID=UPI002435BD7A|nr:GNAT family N-acetyltransferase [Methylobacterium indicum]
MERTLDLRLRTIVEAYRWQRGLGHQTVETQYARVVRNPDHPEVWDANHIDTVTAETPEQIDGVFQAMSDHLGHSPWGVIHTDPFTPEPFTARLALDGFKEQPAVIQMRLEGQVRARSITDLNPVENESDWEALAALVRRDHDEGARTGGAVLAPEVTDGIVAGYRAKQGAYRFHLACVDGQPVAYGASATAPSGAGIIEDLFTLPAYRRQGIASGMIAAFAGELRACGCSSVFLGAVVGEQARYLYAKLGFRPLLLTRCWVRSRAHEPEKTEGRTTRLTRDT